VLIMFSWLHKKKKREILKLIYQNSVFLEIHTQVYDQDQEAKENFLVVKKINDTFLESEDIDSDLLNTLFSINKAARVFYNKHDPEIKLFRAKLATTKPKTFDQRFVPILGWKSYYESFGY